MNEELQKVRSVQCELVQWADRVNCRRCRQKLPAPVIEKRKMRVSREVWDRRAMGKIHDPARKSYAAEVRSTPCVLTAFSPAEETSSAPVDLRMSFALDTSSELLQ